MLEKIKTIIQNFIKKYIVAEDPNIGEEEKIFQEKKKQFEEWQNPSPPKKKRGRPKKK